MVSKLKLMVHGAIEYCMGNGINVSLRSFSKNHIDVLLQKDKENRV